MSTPPQRQWCSQGARLWVSWDNNEDGHVRAAEEKGNQLSRKTIGPGRWMEMGVAPQSHALTECCEVKMLLCAHRELRIRVKWMFSSPFLVH